MVLLKLLLDRQVLYEIEVRLSSGAGMLSGKVLPSDARLSSSSGTSAVRLLHCTKFLSD